MFGVEKLEWRGVAGKSLTICLVVSTHCRRVTDRRMDRHISCDSIVRAAPNIAR